MDKCHPRYLGFSVDMSVFELIFLALQHFPEKKTKNGA